MSERTYTRADLLRLIDKVAGRIERDLPENGAADPQDATDRIIDQAHRDVAERIRDIDIDEILPPPESTR